MIYIASPYSHPDAWMMEERYNAVTRFTAGLLGSGLIVFSPIAHCHELSRQYKLPSTFEFWRKYCLGMLDKADELYVLKLTGWEESRGVQEEIAYASTKGIPLTYW